MSKDENFVMELLEFDNDLLKVYIDYMEMHFLFRHAEERRRELRAELLKLLQTKGYMGKIKVFDTINKIITHFYWREPDTYEPKGCYEKIHPIPYQSFKEKVVIKAKREEGYLVLLERIRKNKEKLKNG